MCVLLFFFFLFSIWYFCIKSSAYAAYTRYVNAPCAPRANQSNLLDEARQDERDTRYEKFPEIHSIYNGVKTGATNNKRLHPHPLCVCVRLVVCQCQSVCVCVCASKWWRSAKFSCINKSNLRFTPRENFENVVRLCASNGFDFYYAQNALKIHKNGRLHNRQENQKK